MKRLAMLPLLVALAGCNTFEGFGRDLAAGGEALEEAAVEAKQPTPQPVYVPAPQQQIIYTQPVPNSQPVPNTQYVY